MSRNALMQGKEDNVATAIEPLTKGARIEAVYHDDPAVILEAGEDIPFGFKVAVCDIPKGEAIRKYGEVIGQSSEHIKAGSMVHVHNVEGTRGRGDTA